MPRQSREERKMAELIAKSLRAIEGRRWTERERMFVKVERVMRRKSMAPTDHQADLYAWIKRQGFVRKELTLGMHYGMLGGLMARGLVVRAFQGGVEGVKAVEP